MRPQTSSFQGIHCLLFLTLLIPFVSSATSSTRNTLARGSFLAVEDDDDSGKLVSSDGIFTCGFYGMGQNAYWFSIWFTNSRERTVVWTANRDRPIYHKRSRVSLQQDGAMVLTDVDGTIIWETNTTLPDVNRAELLDSGNLVLKNSRGKILWQSFDFPTDTLLPNQLFTKSSKLVSRQGIGSFASGFFSFLFDNDNVLKLMYDGSDTSSLYWPDPDYSVFQKGRTNYNSSRVAVLTEMGNLLSSDELDFRASDMGHGIRRRLTMDYDGNLRLYSLDSVTGLWKITWEAMLELCKVHGLCGRNGICVYTPEPKCSCPPGYEISDPDDWSKGCKPKFDLSCSQSQQVKFVLVQFVDFYGFDLNFSESISRESCMEMCLQDCRCEAFGYRLSGEGVCYIKSALFNGYWSPSFPGSIYLKLPESLEEESKVDFLNGTEPICRSSESSIIVGSPSMYKSLSRKPRFAYLYWFVSAIAVIEILFTVSGWWLLFGRNGAPDIIEHGYRALSSQFRKFTYNELKKATNNFKQELGKGGSGAVYKGVLADERVVAVKKLGDSYQGDDEFWAEVNFIGRINHMNLVTMWGFCSENKHRLLVYEFMNSQSLDKHLFSQPFIGWKERFKVALGTAKGLAYLHHECLEWIIHCDVKPENILLNTEFDVKLADFGLAKLSRRGGSCCSDRFTKVRGTKGYMAPEWALNLPITAKIDVYSYGVILELVRGSRVSNWVVNVDEEQEPELTSFVREMKGRILSKDYSWTEETVDPRLQGRFSRYQVAKVVELGISCVEEDSSKRPTMDSVVQALLACEDESTIS